MPSYNVNRDLNQLLNDYNTGVISYTNMNWVVTASGVPFDNQDILRVVFRAAFDLTSAPPTYNTPYQVWWTITQAKEEK